MSEAVESPLAGRMIFNIGSRRSGTYWLQRIVCAHPIVGEIPSETHLLSHGIAPLLERFQHSDRADQEVGRVYVDRERLISSLRALCDTVFAEFREPGNERVAERTPLHALHLPLIAEIYPDAQFVHIIRDGRDVARSIASQDWGPETVEGAAREWRGAVEAARAADLGEERYREVRYEALLADPRAEIEGLYAWLGIPAGEEDLRHPLEESSRQLNVDQRGVGGVGSGKWEEAFGPSELAAFDSVAGDLLATLGYRVATEPSDAGRGSAPRRMAGSISRRLRR